MELSMDNMDIIAGGILDVYKRQMVNGPNDIFYEKAGRIQRFKGHFSSEEKLSLIHIFCSPS